MAAAPTDDSSPRITLESLLGEMTDLHALAHFPDPPFVTRQASSYDRASRSRAKDWFANDDRNQFIRSERRLGREEYVMLEADGPGAIVRIWSANAKGRLRFYLNGAEEPSYEFDMQQLLGGRHRLFPPPLSGVRSGGWNLYFPIPYSRSIKVTADEPETFYYHVNYRTYDEGVDVEDFTLIGVQALASKIQSLVERLDSIGASPPSLATAPHLQLAHRERKRIFRSRHPQSSVDRFSLHLKAGDIETALRGIVLLAYFDGERTPSIESPLGDFFGAAPGVNPYRSLPFTVLEDGTMISRWVMPYRRRAEFYLRNLSGAPASIASDFHVQRLAAGWNERSMHFKANYRPGFAIATRPMRDFNYLTARGRGRYVGNTLSIGNPLKVWWGEGDEKIYVDGEIFPSHFGTGTEDYYGYAWGNNQRFEHAYHNQPRADGPGNYGFTSVNRFHVIDSIPFGSDFRFDMEIWHWGEGIIVDYATVSYWYGRPGASASARPLRRSDLRVPPLAPLELFLVDGAIEAERLPYSSSTGEIRPQSMSSFNGKWSNEEQAWFTGGKPGDWAEFTFSAPSAGRYEVFANFSRALDYAIAEVSVNDAPALANIDFYDPNVVPTGEVSLGVHALRPEGNTLRLEILGANELAEKLYMLGVDYLRLDPDD